MGCHVEDKSDANPQHKQLKCVTNSQQHITKANANPDSNPDKDAHANPDKDAHANPDASERPG